MGSQNTTYGDVSSDKVFYWPSFAHPSDAIDLAVLPTQSVSSLSSIMEDGEQNEVVNGNGAEEVGQSTDDQQQINAKHHQQQNGTPKECYAILEVKMPMDQLFFGNILKLQIGERVCDSKGIFLNIEQHKLDSELVKHRAIYKAMLYPSAEGTDKRNVSDGMGDANLTPTISPIGDDRPNNGQQQQPSAEIGQQNKTKMSESGKGGAKRYRKMSHNPNEAKQPKMKNEIFICGDGWLAVFDLISPHQLGLEIALLSHRFDYYVDEHFKTRKWMLGPIEIEWKNGEDGIKEMQIVNSLDQIVPIPKVPVPKKVVGFKRILIRYIDQNVVDFLRLFCHTFASSRTCLEIESDNNCHLEIPMRNIWQLIKDNICDICWENNKNLTFSQIRQFVPSIFIDCPSLRTFHSIDDVFPMFPSDDSANATDEQLVAKWLFSPSLLLGGAPKCYQCDLASIEQWSTKMDKIKWAFLNASSPANFIIIIWRWFMLDAHMPLFDLTNESTGERLTLKKVAYEECLWLIRCPISRDEKKWAKWEEEVKRWKFDFEQTNQIVINLNDEVESESDLLPTEEDSEGTEVMTDEEDALQFNDI